jgi:murein DD-endopeptidase MepM/ murein hydrolase activator NlpD
MINKVLGVLIQTRVNEALQGVRSEINKQQSGADGGGSEGGAGGGGGAGGYAEGEKNFVASKEIYDYIRSKGVSHTHAMGMLANIQAESSFNAGAIGDSGTSGGLFQHHKERFEGMKSFAGKDWAKNWKRQVDYALREDAGKQYVNKEFKNAQEASAWFTLNFERPSNKEEKARQRLENLNNFNVDGSWKGSQQAPSSKLDFKKLGMQIGERAGYSQSRGRVHAGRDIAIREGTPLRTISDAVIVDKGYEPTGYGHWIIYRDKNGREHMYGHMQNESKFKKGDKILANTIIGSVGSTGRSTGPHLHWEVSNKPGEVGLKRNNVTDPIEMGYSASSPFGGEKNPKPPKPSSSPGQSTTNALNASGMSGSQLSAAIRNIKPGQKLVFSGVGSVQGGKDWLGKPQTKYFDTQGNRLSEEEFAKRFKNSKLKNQIQSKPSQPSKPPGPVPSANLPNRFSGGTIQGLQQYGALQKQGGGYIGKKSPRNISSLSSYPSYSSEGGMMIAIQPMIIEKPVSVPSGQNRSIIFPIPVGVNNSNMQSLSRG